MGVLEDKIDSVQQRLRVAQELAREAEADLARLRGPFGELDELQASVIAALGNATNEDSEWWSPSFLPNPIVEGARAHLNRMREIAIEAHIAREAMEKEVLTLRSACKELSSALSRIDYALGEPNDMGCSGYDVMPDPQAVVKRVESSAAAWQNRVLEQPAPVCPFCMANCGFEVLQSNDEVPRPSQVECGSCGARGPAYFCSDDVNFDPMAAWNKRPSQC
jgi:hypothetical protein